MRDSVVAPGATRGVSRVVSRAVTRKARRRGFSLIELLIVIAIILVIVMIAVPQYNKQLMSAHETAAIQTLRTIHAVEVQYYSQFGRYAASLAELGPPASGAANPAAADLISKDLSEGKKSGYVFTVATIPTGYAISAVPEAFNSSGRRTFYSDQTMVVRNNWSQEPATANSPEAR
ncbi:MAG: prepilin-type N-terminal cleavage/methylation domain-containing protein [Acidobacteriota bacterium]